MNDTLNSENTTEKNVNGNGFQQEKDTYEKYKRMKDSTHMVIVFGSIFGFIHFYHKFLHFFHFTE